MQVEGFGLRNYLNCIVLDFMHDALDYCKNNNTKIILKQFHFVI